MVFEPTIRDNQFTSFLILNSFLSHLLICLFVYFGGVCICIGTPDISYLEVREQLLGVSSYPPQYMDPGDQTKLSLTADTFTCQAIYLSGSALPTESIT